MATIFHDRRTGTLHVLGNSMSFKDLDAFSRSFQNSPNGEMVFTDGDATYRNEHGNRIERSRTHYGEYRDMLKRDDDVRETAARKQGR